MGIIDDLKNKAQEQQIGKIKVPNGMDTNNPLSVIGINTFDDTAKEISKRPLESVIEEVKEVLEKTTSTIDVNSSLDKLNKAHIAVHNCTILLMGYTWEEAGFWRDIVQSTMNALREIGANQIKGKLYVIK